MALRKHLVALIFSGMAVAGFAQENIVHFYPFAPVGGQFQMGYERLINDNAGLQLTAGLVRGRVFSIFEADNPLTNNSLRTGWIVIPSARFYMKKDTIGILPVELYVSPFARLKKERQYIFGRQRWQAEDEAQAYLHELSIGTGVMVGYVVDYTAGWGIDVGVGMMYKQRVILDAHEKPGFSPILRHDEFFDKGFHLRLDVHFTFPF